MSFLDGLFKPNVEKRKAKGDIDGLIKALCYEKDSMVREKAVSALGEIRDNRAIEPLIARLKDTNESVRKNAISSLVKIGAPAVEPLIAALKDSDKDMRRCAASALDNIGWKPDKGLSGAAYWIGKGNFDECVNIGRPAVISYGHKNI